MVFYSSPKGITPQKLKDLYILKTKYSIKHQNTFMSLFQY